MHVRHGQSLKNSKTNISDGLMCLRKILKYIYKDRITNIEVIYRILQAIAPHSDILTKVKARKLLWYGHIFRNNNSKSKVIFQCNVNSTTRREDKMNWSDNIQYLTGLTPCLSMRETNDRLK